MTQAEQATLLRSAGTDDVGALTRVHVAARAAAVPAMPRLMHPPAEVCEHLARCVDTQEIWVATVDEVVVGYVALTRTWMDSLYVDPAHQGRGVGTMLLDLAKSLRPGGFALWVFETNSAARSFYGRHGLVELEHTDGSGNEERSPDLRMAWLGHDPGGCLRSWIEDVDREVAELAAQRAALVSALVTAPGPVAGG